MPYLPDAPDLASLLQQPADLQTPVRTKGGNLMNGSTTDGSVISVGMARESPMNGEVQALSSFPPLEPDVERGTVTCLESAPTATKGSEQLVVAPMEGMEIGSRPPSPPESGTATPRPDSPFVPHRLRPLIPPPNYGAVKDNLVYRSSFPQDRNLDFLHGLEIRTVLCLVDTTPTEAYQHWINSERITRHRVDIAPNKEGKVATTWDSLCEALLIVMDAANYPLYVHCNQGRHRTGCLVSCLRKIQRLPIDEILAEYKTYADPKARTGDIELIQAFDPDAVFNYAKANGFMDGHSSLRRLDSAMANIDALAEALASQPMYTEEVEEEEDILSRTSTSSSLCSNFSETNVMMRATSAEMGMSTDAPAGRSFVERAVARLDTIMGKAAPKSAVVSDAETAEESDLTMAEAGDLGVVHETSTTATIDMEPVTTVVELGDEALSPPAV